MEDIIADVEIVKSLAKKYPGKMQVIDDVCISKGGKHFTLNQGSSLIALREVSSSEVTNPMDLQRKISQNIADMAS